MNIYNYNHLFYFYITAKLKGVTAAAKHLNTSQSSLSTQIKTLEHSLNKKLFKKVGRKIELTDAGREVYNYCRRAFDVFDEMLDQIHHQRSSMGARISIGVAVDIERPFVADILSKVSKKFPKNNRPLLNLISLPAAQLLPLLKIGEIDLLLSTQVALDNEIQNIETFHLPVGIIGTSQMAAEVKLEQSYKNDSKELIPFALPSKMTSLRSEIDDYFIRKKIKSACTFESNIISSVIRATADGIGLTCLPIVYAHQEIKSRRLVLVNFKVNWKHRLNLLASRQNMDESRLDFIKQFTEQLRSYIYTDIKSRPE